MPLFRVHRPRGMFAGLAALALVWPAAAEARCANAEARPDLVSERAMGRATACLVNRERARRGMGALRVNDRLSRAALSHTLDMVRHRYFAHVSRTGVELIDRITVAGYPTRARRWEAAENLAWGSGTSATPRRILARWMRSRGHRANILYRRFRDIGIGVVTGSGAAAPAAAYTITFGYRRFD